MATFDDNFTSEATDAGQRMTEALDVVVAAARSHLLCLNEEAGSGGWEGHDEHCRAEAARIGQALAVLNGEG